MVFLKNIQYGWLCVLFFSLTSMLCLPIHFENKKGDIVTLNILRKKYKKSVVFVNFSRTL